MWRRLLDLLGVRQRRLEDAHVDAVVDVLHALRTDILAEMATQPGEWRLYQLEALLEVIDGMVARRAAEAAAVSGRYLPEALALGATQGTIGISAARRAALGLADLSPALVEAVVTVTQTQVQDVWAELGADLRHTVRRTTLGVLRPDEAIAALVPSIRDAKSFGTAAARADTIVRTETNRAFNLAAAARLDEMHAALGDEVRKRWVSFTDEKTRKTHREANRRYGFDGTAIRVSERFVVGGALMRYPHDPDAPVREVANCRCKLVPVIVEDEG